jgi:hypothetical protein
MGWMEGPLDDLLHLERERERAGSRGDTFSWSRRLDLFCTVIYSQLGPSLSQGYTTALIVGTSFVRLST